MNYLDMTGRYCTLTMQIGFLEDQIARGDDDLSLLRELAFLRDEQRRVGEKIDEYNAAESWGCD